VDTAGSAEDDVVTARPSAEGPLQAPLFQAAGVGKRFGGAVALADVSIDLTAGRVLGVVGENGAGKSTLMKILGGVYPAGSYEGKVLLQGAEVRFRTVQDARTAGIVLIPQELHIAPGLSIAENMFAGALPARRRLLDAAALHAKARTWLAFFELDVDPLLPASILSPSEQRLVLIAGALSLKAQILILDEPTASLSEGEAQTLFRHVERLRGEGIGILFISHRLDDIAQVCDEVTVFRNGRLVAHFPNPNAPRAEIVAAMIGKSIDRAARRPRPSKPRAVVLDVDRLVVRDPRDRERRRVDEVSFRVGAGEIVGLFGLVGAGRTEILRALFGTWPIPFEGSLTLQGRPYRPQSPTSAIRAGVGLLTEDRKQSGIFAGHSLMANFDAASPGPVSRYGMFRTHRDHNRAKGLMKTLDVRARTSAQNIETLSGGNQQKVVLGRWLATDPVLLLLDEPTAGVDVGAREDIYVEVERLAVAGCAVVLVSSDLDEIVRLADHTYVMYKGRLVAEYEEEPTTRHDLMAAATGGLQ